MRQAAIPGMSRAARWLREYVPDRNPLRRASDRAQAAIIGLLLMVFLAAAPLAAILAGSWADGPRPVARPDALPRRGGAARWRAPADRVRLRGRR